jgi:molybdopterin synthase sulfur carrier subunit
MHDSATASTTRIALVYLARLREAFGCAGETLVLPARDAPVTVDDVLAQLAARGGPWAAELAPGRAVRVAVNHTMTARDARVRAGDEVALFPPVTGG